MDKIWISGSVGHHGRNVSSDVETVQKRLNELMRTGRKKLVPDGFCGPITIGIILDFQVGVVGLSDPDARVDVIGPTMTALNDPGSAAKWKTDNSVSQVAPVVGNVRLEVPLVYQRNTMSCWYASVCMVAYYFEHGPRLGLPDKWIENSGLNPYEPPRLARAEGFVEVKSLRNETCAELARLLGRFGPLWCYGVWDGFYHAVVLTGVVGDDVYINDPAPSMGRRVKPLQWFHDKRQIHFANPFLRYSK